MHLTLKDPFKRLKSNIPYPFLSAISLNSYHFSDTWIIPFGWNMSPVVPLEGVPSVYKLIARRSHGQTSSVQLGYGRPYSTCFVLVQLTLNACSIGKMSCITDYQAGSFDSLPTNRVLHVILYFLVS